MFYTLNAALQKTMVKIKPRKTSVRQVLFIVRAGVVKTPKFISVYCTEFKSYTVQHYLRTLVNCQKTIGFSDFRVTSVNGKWQSLAIAWQKKHLNLKSDFCFIEFPSNSL